MNRVDVLVAGNGVAAMVAATELARAGQRVALWNPAPQWGAHFGGLELAGRKFDIGMNLLEFTSFAAQSPDARAYAAAVRNDAARFTGIVRDYLAKLVDFAAADTPQCLLGGKFAPDIVIANQLDLLDRLPAETAARARVELTQCVAALQAEPEWHARNKVSRMEQFAAADYRRISLANHGPTLHELLIEPTCRRILGLPAEEVSALLHRVAWTPLYYPETLLARLEGRAQSLAPTLFHYPCAGNFAAVIRALEARLAGLPSLQVNRDKTARLVRTAGGWSLQGEGTALAAERLVWGQRGGQLAALLGGEDDFAAYRKASVYVAFATVRAEAFVQRFSTLFLLDAESPVYRVSDQAFSAGAVNQPAADCTIELSASAAAAWRLDDPAAATAAIAGELVRRGVLRDPAGLTLHAVKYFKDAIIAPTPANRRRALENHARLTAAQPDVDLIGPAAPFGASSFNDNILQGLRLGRMHSRAVSGQFTVGQ